ncbi:hypothetical protein HYV81_03895 [Candidatus Woesearchaeota archaeon]|nr:hypothetical protein [Candidatus Woesearchaeota archaeon]
MADEELKRATAYKVSVKELLNGTFLRTDNAPSFLLSENGRKILRVNLIGILVEIISETMWLLDDGTGSIMVRSFNKLPFYVAGDLVLVIGKVREINEERYIVVEIARKLTDNGWLRLRAAELQKEIPVQQAVAIETVEQMADGQEIYDSIKKLDTGNGVALSVLTEKFGEGAEAYVSKLLEHGEIFEVQPGRVKVLE